MFNNVSCTHFGGSKRILSAKNGYFCRPLNNKYVLRQVKSTARLSDHNFLCETFPNWLFPVRWIWWAVKFGFFWVRRSRIPKKSKFNCEAIHWTGKSKFGNVKHRKLWSESQACFEPYEASVYVVKRQAKLSFLRQPLANSYSIRMHFLLEKKINLAC